MRAGSQNYFLSLIKKTLLIGHLSLLIIISCAPLSLKKTAQATQDIHVDRSYYSNGQLEYEAEYLNNKLDGISRYWTEDGILISESEYSNGQENASWKKYHPNGSLMNDTEYFHGKKHGFEKWYYENGNLKSEVQYKFGEPITKIIRWNPDGTIIY